MFGWEPREFTEYVYEDDRLVGSVTTREPEFSPEQVDLLLAHEAYMADLGPHGHRMSVATSKGATFAADPIPTIDKAARAIKMAERAYFKQWPEEADKGGVLFAAHRTDI